MSSEAFLAKRMGIKVSCDVCKNELDTSELGRTYFQQSKKEGFLFFCSLNCQLISICKTDTDTAEFLLKHYLDEQIYYEEWGKNVNLYSMLKSDREELMNAGVRLFEGWKERPALLSSDTIIRVIKQIKFYKRIYPHYCWNKTHIRSVSFTYPDGKAGRLCLDCNKPQSNMDEFLSEGELPLVSPEIREIQSNKKVEVSRNERRRS